MALIRVRPFAQALPSRDERAWTPPVDMYETKNEVVVTVELPGVSDKDIRLSITGDLLTIHAERQWSDETGDAAGALVREVRAGALAPDSRRDRAGQGDLSGRRAHGEPSEDRRGEAQGDHDRRGLVSTKPAGGR